MKSYRELINTISRQLAPVYPSSREQRQVAWWMLEAITGMSRATLLAERPQLTNKQQAILKDWILEQVEDHKPLQYLIGSVPFLDLLIKVEPPIAIPRPETEYWVDELIHMLTPVNDQALNILDLCTGSGCIALALAHGLPKSYVTGVDINENALKVAQQNSIENGIETAEFLYSDLFTNLQGKKFDLIVGNPPYISPSEWQNIDPRVREWEDERAMKAKEEGLAVIRAIIEQTPEFLAFPSILEKKKLPRLVLEIGSTQGPRVKELLEEHGYTDISIMQDQYGNDRVALASYTNY